MRKRSARLEEPFVFFIDRCLGRTRVAAELRAGLGDGEQIEIHDDHFAAGARDVDWLPTVGRRGWAVLSQDARIGRNPMERLALEQASVAFFGVRAAQATAVQQG